MPHHVRGNDAGGAGLSTDGMDEDAFVGIHGIVDEVIDFVRRFVSTIEEYLIFLVEPRVRQVLYTDIGPLILHLATAAIDDS